jgi:hypothetical protein
MVHECGSETEANLAKGALQHSKRGGRVGPVSAQQIAQSLIFKNSQSMHTDLQYNPADSPRL